MSYMLWSIPNNYCNNMRSFFCEKCYADSIIHKPVIYIIYLRDARYAG